MQGYLYVLATLLLTVAGQLLVKWRALEIAGSEATSDRLSYLLAMFTDPFVILGLGLAVLASVSWMLAVQGMAVSVAYPFMALSFLLVPLAAVLFFGEALGAFQVLGLLLIVAGVALTGLR